MLKSRLLTVRFVFILTLLLGFMAYLIYSCRTSPDIILSDWPIYYDSQLGITFQYPPDWKVQYEQYKNGKVILISPPNANQRLSYMHGDDSAGIYGIRISSYGTYPAVPAVALTDNVTDFENGLRSVKPAFFRMLEMTDKTGPDKSILVYDIGGDNRSMVLYKTINGCTYQLEMGQYYSGTTLSDVVDFVAVSVSLKSSIDR